MSDKISQALAKARIRIQRLERSALSADIKAVKATDIGLRLTAEVCLDALHDSEDGMTYVAMADELRRKGVKDVAHDRPGKYAVASHTPTPEVVAKLYRMWEQKSGTLFKRARGKSTPFVEPKED